MKKQLLIIILLTSTICSFGQIDNRFIKTDSATIKTLIGTGLRTLAVNSSGTIVRDSNRIAVKDSQITYYTPAYIDANFANIDDIEIAASGIQVKDTVSCASTANLDLTGSETIDGIATTTGMRVLVKNQTDSIQNGCYTANNSGVWVRAVDSDTWSELLGASYLVNRGATQQYFSFVCGVASGGTVGVNKIWFNISTRSEAIVAGDGLLRVGNELSVNTDNSTIESNSNKLRVKDGSITSGKLSSGIDAAKIGNGTISNTEFQQLDGVTSNIKNDMLNIINKNTVGLSKRLTDVTWTYTNTGSLMLKVERRDFDTQILTATYSLMPRASSTYTGVMSQDQYVKLSSVETGAEVNVQADMTETNTATDSYVRNKPDFIVKTDTIHDGIEQVVTKAVLDSTISAIEIPTGDFYTTSQTDSLLEIVTIDSMRTIRNQTFIFYSDGRIDSTGRELVQLGDLYQGGYVFYVDPSGTWGYCATQSTIATSVPWSLTKTNISGASGLTISSGEANTTAIVANQGAGTYAAKLCSDYTIMGYDDWYLPSSVALDSIFRVLKQDHGIAYPINIWSSSQYGGDPTNIVWYHNMSTALNPADKTGVGMYVLAVRTWEIQAADQLPVGTSGDMLKFKNSTWQTIPVGAEGQTMQVISGEPAWGTLNAGDITGITTASGSGLAGGAATGTPSLTLDINNITASTTSLSADSKIPVTYGTATRYITATNMRSWMGGGTGTVTSVAKGNGMNFSTITSSGTITLGYDPTLSSISKSTSTNVPAIGYHSHVFDSESYLLSDLAGISAPTVANTYLKVTTLGASPTYTWAAGTGSAGVTSITLPTSAGLYNWGTAADQQIGLNIFGLATTVTPSLSDYIPFADYSSVTSPKLCEKMTLQTLKNTLSAGLTVISGDDSIQNVRRLILEGSVTITPTDLGDGNVTATITGGSGGGELGFTPLDQTGNVNWSWLASNNAQITDMDDDIVLSFTYQAQSRFYSGYLEVVGDPTAAYTLTFPAGCWFANGHSKSFNIEAGTKYVFYLKYTGASTNIDYASYQIAN